MKDNLASRIPFFLQGNMVNCIQNLLHSFSIGILSIFIPFLFLQQEYSIKKRFVKLLFWLLHYHNFMNIQHLLTKSQGDRGENLRRVSIYLIILTKYWVLNDISRYEDCYHHRQLCLLYIMNFTRKLSYQ